MEVFIQQDKGCVNKVTQNDMAMSPLYCAAMDGRTSVVRVLLQHGAVVSLADVNGVTPLMAACAGNHVDCGLLLLDNDAPIEQCTLKGYAVLLRDCFIVFS